MTGSQTVAGGPRGLRQGLIGLTLCVGLALSAAAHAQERAPRDEELLRDFIHFVRIDRPDLAASFGEALLARLGPPIGTAAQGQGLSLEQFVKLLESSGELARFEEATARAQRQGDVQSVASKLQQALEQGRRNTSRDPGQIAASVQLLVGTQRQRLVARERLGAAGEYAVPQLLTALQSRQNATLTAEVRLLLVDMGLKAVAPLAAALEGLEPAAQETVAGTLGDIGYPVALPYLSELLTTATTQGPRDAARRAIARITGAEPGERPDVSAQYEALAEGFYDQPSQLIAYPGEAQQPVWSYDPRLGLFPTTVDTAVFHETQALRLAERALRIDPSRSSALALWLAGNFRRELDTPSGYVNPLYDRRKAEYWAVLAGPSACQRVLARALDDRDTPLARMSIAALIQMAGAQSLSAPEEGRRPLLEALRYPNRRVQLEAALALAQAQPAQTFDGADRVIPILSSAVRDAGRLFAVVLASDNERAGSLVDQLTQRGYTVLPPAGALPEIEQEIAAAPGIDLLVTDLTLSRTQAALEQARGIVRLQATPIVSLLSTESQVELAGRYSQDPGVRFVRPGLTPEQLAENVTQVVTASTGGVITADEADAYRDRALSTLRDLAIADSPVFDVVDATAPLIGELGSATGSVRLRIADVLAAVPDHRAQVAVLDAALASADDEQLALFRSATDSAKRFGNLATDRQVQRLLDLAGTGTDEQATTAAALIGALNVRNQNLVPLILKQPAQAGSGTARR